MNDKIFEIQEKWDKGCETGDFDQGDLFGQLLDIAYGLDNQLNEVKNNVVSDDVSDTVCIHDWEIYKKSVKCTKCGLVPEEKY